MSGFVVSMPAPTTSPPLRHTGPLPARRWRRRAPAQSRRTRSRSKLRRGSTIRRRFSSASSVSPRIARHLVSGLCYIECRSFGSRDRALGRRGRALTPHPGARRSSGTTVNRELYDGRGGRHSTVLGQSRERLQIDDRHRVSFNSENPLVM
jgi:hypothetical protein